MTVRCPGVSGLVLILLVLPGCSEDFDTGEPITTVKLADPGRQPRQGEDWPQWRGIHRDGLSPETSLQDAWSGEGPSEIWRRPLGEGYSSLAVSEGWLFTLDQTDAEYVVSLSTEDGSDRWRVKIDEVFEDSQGNGPRGTPTVEGPAVYAVGAQGTAVALETSTGRVLWERDLEQDLGGSAPRWGYATSPLVYGDLLLLEPGGAGHSVVALDKRTGDTVWSAFDDKAGYSSPIIIDTGDRSQLITFTATQIVSLSPDSGRVLWNYPWETSYDVNAATPIWLPPDRLFVSSGYGVGGAVLELGDLPDGPAVEVIWKNEEMKNQFSSSVFFEGHLYGFDEATLKCLDAATGQMRWRQRGFGRGSLIVADRKLIILGERGVLALAEATPEEYRETDRAQVLKGKCWTPPALSGGRLYLRNHREVLCLDLANP